MEHTTQRWGRRAQASIDLLDARLLGIATFIAGGLLVFQTSDTVDPAKIVYMLATIVVVVAALARLFEERAIVREQPILVAWLSVSAAFALLVGISFPVAVSNGTPVMSWLRDAAPYGMFAIAPVLAVDGRSLSRQRFVGALVVSGLLAAASFSIEWMGRRGILELPIERLILPTGILASTLLGYAAARALLDPRTVRWIVLGGAILGLFFVTGTRSTLLLLAVPCVVALSSRRSPRRTIGVAGGTFAVGLAIAILFWFAVDALPAYMAQGRGAPAGGDGTPPLTNPIGERIESIGSAIANPGGDASFAERIAQTQAAWTVVLEHKLLGAGPGITIPWVSESRGPQAGFTLDTPLVFPAKFGLLGIVALAWLAFVVTATLRTYHRPRDEIAFLTLVGFGIVLMIAGLLNSPFEDKGLSFATLLVLGATFAQNPETAPASVDSRAAVTAVAATR